MVTNYTTLKKLLHLTRDLGIFKKLVKQLEWQDRRVNNSLKCLLLLEKKIFALSSWSTDYGRPMKSFLIEIQIFLAWANKLGR